jgi:hypothetical protein
LVILFFACRLGLLFTGGGPVKFTVLPPAVLDSAVFGSSTPLNRVVMVQPEGPDSVTWKTSVAAGSRWLTIKTSGGTGAGALSLSLAPYSLAPGRYEDTVLVLVDGWEDRAVKIPIAFTVRTVSFQLGFTVQPASGRAGSAISPAVQVTARDAAGRTVTSFSGNVSIALGTNLTGATLSGTSTVAAVNGVARFANLVVDRQGIGYTLRATSGTLSVTSNAFNMAWKNNSAALGIDQPVAVTR